MVQTAGRLPPRPFCNAQTTPSTGLRVRIRQTAPWRTIAQALPQAEGSPEGWAGCRWPSQGPRHHHSPLQGSMGAPAGPWTAGSGAGVEGTFTSGALTGGFHQQQRLAERLRASGRGGPVRATAVPQYNVPRPASLFRQFPLPAAQVPPQQWRSVGGNEAAQRKQQARRHGSSQWCGQKVESQQQAGTRAGSQGHQALQGRAIGRK